MLVVNVSHLQPFDPSYDITLQTWECGKELLQGSMGLCVLRGIRSNLQAATEHAIDKTPWLAAGSSRGAASQTCLRAIWEPRQRKTTMA